LAGEAERSHGGGSLPSRLTPLRRGVAPVVPCSSGPAAETESVSAMEEKTREDREKATPAAKVVFSFPARVLLCFDEVGGSISHE
jgi:hypothetical protein